MNKKIISILLVIIIAIPLFEIAKVIYASSASNQPIFYTASSSAFILTTTSTQLLATSTSPKRVGAAIQPINCTTGSTQGAFLKMNNDAPATANTGTFAFASSTLLLGEYMNQLPVVQGAVRGIVGGGTCTVLVTEWRLITP